MRRDDLQREEKTSLASKLEKEGVRGRRVIGSEVEVTAMVVLEDKITPVTWDDRAWSFTIQRNLPVRIGTCLKPVPTSSSQVLPCHVSQSTLWLSHYSTLQTENFMWFQRLVARQKVSIYMNHKKSLVHTPFKCNTQLLNEILLLGAFRLRVGTLGWN